MSIEALLKEYGERIDQTLERFLNDKLPGSAHLPLQFSWPMSFEAYRLYEGTRWFVKGPGKRIRPILALLSYNAFTYGKSVDLTAFAALELFHDYLLIHDDIMDKDDVRRGRPAMHKWFEDRAKNFKDSEHFGESMAIIAGDLLCHLGYKALFEADDFPLERRLQAAEFITSVLMVTGYGQSLDVYSAHAPLEDFSEKRLLLLVKDIHLAKTADYTFGGPLKYGAILSGIDPYFVDEIYVAGIYAGMAFQIKDDIMGIERPWKLLKKKNDIKEGKLTYPIAVAAQKDKSILNYLRDGDVEEVLRIVDETRAVPRSEWDMNDYARKGRLILERLDDFDDVDSYWLNLISEIFDFAIKRER